MSGLGGTQKWNIYVFLPLCNSYHATINHNFVEARPIIQKVLHKELFIVLIFLFICPKQPTARITAYLTVILVNHNSCSYLSPPSSPSSHHPRFLPVYGTTLCMINWYGWISKYEALTKLCKLTDHVFTMPVMLVNKHSSKSTINTTQVDPTKSVKKNKMCNYPFICIVVETRDGMWSQKYICQTEFVPPFQ